MVWGGVFGNRIIGPYIFENNVNRGTYNDFLRNDLDGLLDAAEIPAERRARMVWQQDGAGPHRANEVRQTLNARFPNRWIGLGGPIPWPPYSPDLTPCDFFLWGFIKDFVYARHPQNREHMIELIREAFRSVTVPMLERVRQSFLDRIRLAVDFDGRHVEHIINCVNCNIYRPRRGGH